MSLINRIIELGIACACWGVGLLALTITTVIIHESF